MIRVYISLDEPYRNLEHTCTGVTAEMAEINYSTRFS